MADAATASYDFRTFVTDPSILVHVQFKDGPPTSVSSNGLPYIKLINGELVPEGADHLPFILVAPGAHKEAFRSAQIAFNRGLATLLRDTNAVEVEWRIPPEVEWYTDDGHPVDDPATASRVYIRARLAVTKHG